MRLRGTKQSNHMRRNTAMHILLLKKRYEEGERNSGLSKMGTITDKLKRGKTSAKKVGINLLKGGKRMGVQGWVTDENRCPLTPGTRICMH